MSAIKEIRKEQKLTQQQAAELIGISIRSFKSYENDENKIGTLKYKYILDKLTEFNRLDEDHGILSIESITEKCAEVFNEYQVYYCILFGSYAKGSAGESSDSLRIQVTSTHFPSTVILHSSYAGQYLPTSVS